jgi:hypothetical protein
MASKGKRRAAARRRQAPPRPDATQSSSERSQIGGRATPARGVALELAPRSARAKVAGRAQIEDADPGIPLSQVPYFTSDLIRLGVVAAIMVALLLVGAQLVPK